MDKMREGVGGGKTFRFNRSMAYKIVESLAQFHPDYRGVDEVILDNDTMEALCSINFGTVKKGGIFHTHPGYIDGLTQSGGFVMNANDNTDLGVEVFVNHGWKSFQLFEKISPEKTYHTHVRMFEDVGKMWKGDVIVFEGDRIAASVKGVIVSRCTRWPLILH
jgi:iterative type I PKS product template protein